MEEQQLTVEDIERRQRLLAVLFKVFVAIMILIGCVFVGWLISFIGYAHDGLNFGAKDLPTHCAGVITELGRTAAVFIA